MEIRQGDEILVKAEVTGTLTGYKAEDRYRVRIGDQVIWVMRDYIAYWREHPDMFINFLQTGDNVTPKDIKEDE